MSRLAFSLYQSLAFLFLTTAGRGIHLARATRRVPQRGDDHAQRPDRGHLSPLPRHRAATARRGHGAAGQPGARAVAP